MPFDPQTNAAAKANARKALVALDAIDAIVESYIASSDTTLVRFGLESSGQPDLVHRMRRGVDMRRSTLRKVLEHIAA